MVVTLSHHTVRDSFLALKGMGLRLQGLKVTRAFYLVPKHDGQPLRTLEQSDQKGPSCKGPRPSRWTLLVEMAMVYPHLPSSKEKKHHQNAGGPI